MSGALPDVLPDVMPDVMPAVAPEVTGATGVVPDALEFLPEVPATWSDPVPAADRDGTEAVRAWSAVSAVPSSVSSSPVRVLGPDPTRSGRWSARLVALPAAVFLLQAIPLAFMVGVTTDEQTYLMSGRLAWLHASGTDFIRYASGPLSQLLAALPSVVVEWITGRPMGFVAGVVAGRLVCLALFGVGTLIAADGLLRGKVSDRARTVSLLLLAMSPLFVAHASLMTTDVAFVATGLAFLGWIERHRVVSRPRDLLLEGVLFGLAFSAKQTAFLLLVPLFLWAVQSSLQSSLQSSVQSRMQSRVESAAHSMVQTAARPRDWLVAIGASTFRVVNATVIGLLVSWGLSFGSYGTEIPWGGGSSAVPLPAPIIGFLGQINHSRFGHMNFFLGDVSMRGFRWYFPVAWALKATPIEAGCVLVALVLVLRLALLRGLTRANRPGRVSRRSVVQSLCSIDFWPTYPLLAAGLILASAVVGNINNGVRIVLFSIVVGHVVAASAVIDWMIGATASAGPTAPSRWCRASRESCASGWKLVFLVVVVGWQAGSAASAFPNNLSYFTPAAGRAENRYRLLQDSNLDWGQDYVYLPRDQSKMILDLAGATPALVGITARPLDQIADANAFAPDTTLVVSTFNLYVRYWPVATELRSFKPDAVYGSSLFAYRLNSPAKRHAATTYLLGMLKAEADTKADVLQKACATVTWSNAFCPVPSPTQ